MITIKLRKEEWYYDPNKPLGPAGGFGTVFQGVSVNRNSVAVKRLKIEADKAGHRELEIAEELEGRQLKHVLPFYDSGVDAESGRYFVVMAIADLSLQDYIPSDGISEEESIKILRQIVNGLIEVQDIVHRDLKPPNILLHDGIWKIADFGIARFVEETTSFQTVKGFLSPLYAAPEQWRFERATNATDIYALACIAYTLISGNPPFHNNNMETLRDNHLNGTPPSLPVSPRLNQYLMTCLRKNPRARPSLESSSRQLENMELHRNVNEDLAIAGSAIAKRQAQEEAESMKQRVQEDNRIELAKDALELLRLLLRDLFDKILSDVSIANCLYSQMRIQLGNAELIASIPFQYLPIYEFPNWGADIICGAYISVHQNYPQYPQRSASLWFGDMESSGEYRWWEMTYFNDASMRTPSINRPAPFGILSKNELKYADIASSNKMGSVNLASKPIPIDGEYFEEFVSRWSKFLAKASQNQLRHPSHLPEN